MEQPNIEEYFEDDNEEGRYVCECGDLTDNKDGVCNYCKYMKNEIGLIE